MMRAQKAVFAARLFLLLAAAAPGLGQGENEPYFSLSTIRTFASNGKPSVELSALQSWIRWSSACIASRTPSSSSSRSRIRTSSAGRVPPPPRERTAIERIHGWKRGLRADIRRSLRAQFSESPSAHLERFLPKEGAAPSLGRRKARITPRPRYSIRSNWCSLSCSRSAATAGGSARPFPLGVKEKGVYLVEAVRHDLRAYTILHGLRRGDDHQDREGPGGQRDGGPQYGRADCLRQDLDAHQGRPEGAGRDQRRGDRGNAGDGGAARRHPRGGPEGRRLRSQRAGELFVQRQYRRLPRLHLYGPAGLSPGAHGPFQGHPPHADSARATTFPPASP